MPLKRISPPRSQPPRIISLAPNVTSILLALGAGRELVGVSKWCKDVAAVGSRAVFGDCWKLDLERVMRERPTLLIGSVPFALEVVGEILKRPVAFLAVNPRSLRDIESDIRTLGRLAGRAANAEKLVARMRREFGGVGQAARKILARTKKRACVYCEAWPNPRISSPLWVGEMVRMAGGAMAVESGMRVTDEEVARAKPDVIILAWAATGDRAKASSALRNPAWRNVPAVRARRVFVIRDELLNTPGPPLMKGARELLRAIHAENGVEIEKEKRC
ncbi:MAG: ABC transporter substrate-binding protein [Candidatus Acidiferrales bacterium]